MAVGVSSGCRLTSCGHERTALGYHLGRTDQFERHRPTRRCRDGWRGSPGIDRISRAELAHHRVPVRDRGVRLEFVLLSRVNCDGIHRDDTMLPKNLRSIGTCT